MNERPILFSGPMVRAILDGHKTMTRRVVKPQPVVVCGRDGKAFDSHNPTMYSSGKTAWTFCHRLTETGNNIYTPCPYGQPGDRLVVRETWLPLDRDHWMADKPKPLDRIAYRADCDADSERCRQDYGYKWRPSIFMPRWASRLTLEVTAVRVDRLQSISEADARAEGIADGGCLTCGNSEPCGCANPQPCARDEFVNLWDGINAERGYPWASNPWVWVIEFQTTTKETR